MGWAEYDEEVQKKQPGKPFSDSLPAVDPRYWNQMFDYLRARSLDPELAMDNGWYPSTTAGDHEVRIVMPATSRHSANKYWQARAVRPENWEGRRYESPHGVNREDAIIVVYPSDEAEGTAFVEGPMDALAAAGAKFIGIAWMGLTPPLEAIVTAELIATPPVMMVSDEGVVKESITLWRRLKYGTTFVNTYPSKDLAAANPAERRWILTLERPEYKLG